MRILWIAVLLFLFLSTGITELIYEVQNGKLFKRQRRFFSRWAGDTEEQIELKFETWGCGTWYLIFTTAAFLLFVYWVGVNNNLFHDFWYGLVLQLINK